MRNWIKWIAVILFLTSSFLMVCYIQYQKITDMTDNTQEEKPIMISVLAGQSTSDAGIEDMIDEALADKFPNVQLEWECVDWGEKFDSQMQARFAAGDVPDIMVGKAQDVASYAVGGNLAPISVICTDKIKEQALQPVTKDGVIYGLPYNILYQGVIYNKDIFKRYHLKPPKTIEELKNIVTVLKEHQITPFAAHLQESWQVGNMMMQFFMNDIFKEQPDWGERFRKGEVDFNNDTVKNCLKQNQYILTNSWDDAMMLDQYESDRRFFEGEAAMYLSGSWSLQSINQYNLNQDFGIFPYPNQSGNSYLIRETNMTFMKSNTTKYGDIVDEIFEELVSNQTLIEDILDFTQTNSAIKGIGLEYQSCIEQDVNRYEQKNQVIEVTTGNNELIWSFQNDLAMKQQDWLQGKIPLSDVLNYADQNRMESSK